eukprot:CFRG7913T1
MTTDWKTVKLLTFSIFIGTFALLELICGITFHSLVLLADSLHMTSDLASLILAAVVVRLSVRGRSELYPFGWARLEIVGALANSLFLVAISFLMIIEGIEHIIMQEVLKEPLYVTLVGCIGLVVNTFGMMLFGHGHGHFLPTCLTCPRRKSSTDDDLKLVSMNSLQHDDFHESQRMIHRPRLSDESLSFVTLTNDLSAEEIRNIHSHEEHYDFHGYSYDIDDDITDCRLEEQTRHNIHHGLLHSTDSFPRHNTSHNHGHSYDGASDHHGHAHHGGSNHNGQTHDNGSDYHAHANDDESDHHGHAHHRGSNHHGHAHDDGSDHHGHAHHGDSDHHGHSHDHDDNIYAVYLHIMGDVVGSIGVIMSGLLNFYVDSDLKFLIDPTITFLVACILLGASLPIVLRTSRVLMQTVPASVDANEIESKIKAFQKVVGVHDLTVWELVSNKYFGTVQVTCEEGADFADIQNNVRLVFIESGVKHVVVEVSEAKE